MYIWKIQLIQTKYFHRTFFYRFPEICNLYLTLAGLDLRVMEGIKWILNVFAPNYGFTQLPIYLKRISPSYLFQASIHICDAVGVTRENLNVFCFNSESRHPWHMLQFKCLYMNMVFYILSEKILCSVVVQNNLFESDNVKTNPTKIAIFNTSILRGCLASWHI